MRLLETLVDAWVWVTSKAASAALWLMRPFSKSIERYLKEKNER